MREGGVSYDYWPHWPAVLYDYRPNGISHRALPEAHISDIPRLCDYYDEQLEACAIDDRQNMLIVRDYIQKIRSQADELTQEDGGFERNINKARDVEEELDILRKGDLAGDPERTPESMHEQLLRVESDYVMLIDTIESYKRRIRMLEESLPADEDPRIY